MILKTSSHISDIIELLSLLLCIYVQNNNKISFDNCLCLCNRLQIKLEPQWLVHGNMNEPAIITGNDWHTLCVCNISLWGHACWILMRHSMTVLRHRFLIIYLLTIKSSSFSWRLQATWYVRFCIILQSKVLALSWRLQINSVHVICWISYDIVLSAQFMWYVRHTNGFCDLSRRVRHVTDVQTVETHLGIIYRVFRDGTRGDGTCHVNGDHQGVRLLACHNKYHCVSTLSPPNKFSLFC